MDLSMLIFAKGGERNGLYHKLRPSRFVSSLLFPWWRVSAPSRVPERSQTCQNGETDMFFNHLSDTKAVRLKSEEL